MEVEVGGVEEAEMVAAVVMVAVAVEDMVIMGRPGDMEVVVVTRPEVVLVVDSVDSMAVVVMVWARASMEEVVVTRPEVVSVVDSVDLMAVVVMVWARARVVVAAVGVQAAVGCQVEARPALWSLLPSMLVG